MYTFLLIALLTVLSTRSEASPLERRQNVTSDISTYLTSIQSGLYAVNRINNGSAEAGCQDENLVGDLDGQGMNGSFAQMLLCETAVGVIVFPNIQQALKDFTFASIGLQYIYRHPGSSAGLSQCRNNTLDTLDQAGIDSAAVISLICPNTTITSTATASNGISASTGDIIPSANLSLPYSWSSSLRTQTLVPLTTAPTTSSYSRSSSLKTETLVPLTTGPTMSSHNTTRTIESSFSTSHVTVIITTTAFVVSSDTTATQPSSTSLLVIGGSTTQHTTSSAGSTYVVISVSGGVTSTTVLPPVLPQTTKATTSLPNTSRLANKPGPVTIVHTVFVTVPRFAPWTRPWWA